MTLKIAVAAIFLTGLAACQPPQKTDIPAADTRSASEAAAQAAENNTATPENIDTAAIAEDTAPTWSKGAMISAADARAVDAGLAILEKGGHAVDAAIAVHAVLGLVEPQSSGIGGGAFMLVYDKSKDELVVFDGREKAPASTTPDHFMKDGEAGLEVMGFLEAWQSGKSVGVPGQVALYKAAHDAYGKSNWDTLFTPAIGMAEEGWTVSARLAGLLSSDRLRGATRLDDDPVTAAYFYPNGEPLPEGYRRTNLAYAETLRDIAEAGPSAFYSGERAKRIADAVGTHPSPGTLTTEDLVAYTVKFRRALCSIQADSVKICSAPPPSSGGVTQNMIYGLYPLLAENGGGSEDRLFAFVDAQRLAYADRDHYVADADFVPVPADDLVDPDYLEARALDRFAPGASPTPGDPAVALGRKPIIGMWGQDPTEEAPGTTHISIIDQNGNAVSMTATIEAAFGSSIMVDGFLLNNELTDFARQPTKSGVPVANAAAANKRPRSSMSPTMVFDADGELLMVTGSPGGNSIVAYVAKTLIGVLKWGLTAQEAADHPNIVARGDRVNVEIDRGNGAELAETLRQKGYNVRERKGEASGVHLIVVRENGLEGGADPRREGVAKALK